ncbi:MAG: hypothetical protein JWQ27_2708 [Ferruginibacter sp.]|nr:hypothetical protein [Ferruginibacter sp.]
MKQQTTKYINADKNSRGLERFATAGLQSTLLLIVLVLIIATGIIIPAASKNDAGGLSKNAVVKITQPAACINYPLHQHLQQENLHKKIWHIKNNFQTFSKSCAEFFPCDKLHKILFTQNQNIMQPLLTIASLRQRFGLSQETLAEYLNTTRSHLSLVEKYNRPLSNTSILKLAQLEGCCAYAFDRRKTKEPPTNLSSAEESILHGDLTLRLLNGKKCLAMLLKKLQQMATQYDQVNQWHTVAGLLKQELPAANPGREWHWLNQQQSLAEQQMAGCNGYAQAALQLKIDLLQAEMGVLGLALDKLRITKL